MKRIPDGSIDAVIADLPFGTTNNVWDRLISFDQLWEQYKRIIKPNGAILLFGQQPFTSHLVMSNRQWFRYEWVWEKENATGFLNANKMPMKIHENILVFYKKLPTYNPQGIRYNPKKAKRGHLGDNYLNTTSNEYHTDYENYPTDILRFKRDKLKLHPTQKPVDLIAYLIKTYTNEGETVLDNTIGSGTTAVAAIRTNRHFIGFELNKEYYKIACERIAKERQQLSLDFKPPTPF